MNNKLFICSADKGDKEDTLLYHTKGDLEVFFKEHNKEPLQKVYNKAIDFAIQENMDQNRKETRRRSCILQGTSGKL